MSKKKRIYTKKDVKVRLILTAFLVVMVFALTYFTVLSDELNPKINELTTSYISFNNNDTTDMIKITNLKKMSNSNGMSFKNKSAKKFKVTGEVGDRYRIILFHTGNDIDNGFVHYSLHVNGDVKENNVLSNVPTLEDGGIVIYDGVVNEDGECVLKMWIDNSYDKNIKNISYEVRIK